jgi:hypothetical protein
MNLHKAARLSRGTLDLIEAAWKERNGVKRAQVTADATSVDFDTKGS